MIKLDNLVAVSTCSWKSSQEYFPNKLRRIRSLIAGSITKPEGVEFLIYSSIVVGPLRHILPRCHFSHLRFYVTTILGGLIVELIIGNVVAKEIGLL
jgi:hypothetical protein